MPIRSDNAPNEPLNSSVTQSAQYAPEASRQTINSTISDLHNRSLELLELVNRLEHIERNLNGGPLSEPRLKNEPIPRDLPENTNLKSSVMNLNETLIDIEARFRSAINRIEEDLTS